MTREEAIRAARLVVEQQGWTWLEPVSVNKSRCLLRKPRWRIATNSHARGCNAIIEIDDKTGAVLSKSYLPR
jgi:hypothetical protein